MQKSTPKPTVMELAILRVLWERGLAADTALADDAADVPGADTEHLRLMMQRYRALFNQLCRP